MVGERERNRPLARAVLARGYVRLIGDRKAIDKLTKTFDRIVVDQGARLDRWAAYLAMLQKRASEIYVYANNHYAGHGPETVRELARRMGGTARRWPRAFWGSPCECSAR